MVKIIDKRWADRELIATAAPAALVQVVFFVVPVVMLIILTFQSSVYFQLVGYGKTMDRPPETSTR